MANKLKVAVFISGNGTNLQAIMDNCTESEVVCVISNQATAYGLERAKLKKIPTHVVSHKEFDTRESFEEALLKILSTYQPDLIVLAGFMRVLSNTFIGVYKDKILNIHPSLLPKYPGLNTHQQVILNQDKEHGVTVHYVTEALDGGPIIAYAKLNVAEDDTSESVSLKVHQLEYQLYPYVIEQIAIGRLQCQDDVVYCDNAALPKQGREWKADHGPKYF